MPRVVASVFTGRGRAGDFAWMIERPEYADALFVFNDNEQQFRAHRAHPGDPDGAGCARGGGNAVIRPYQCRRPQRAAGVPTGPDYLQLTPRIRGVIDEAIAVIAQVAARENYARVFYSAADASGALGTAIFVVGDDVKRYIVESLRALETA